jgi:hypothetical protein
MAQITGYSQEELLNLSYLDALCTVDQAHDPEEM